jgi:hypothetical protein
MGDPLNRRRGRGGDNLVLPPRGIGQDYLDVEDPTYQTRFTDDRSKSKNVVWEREGNLHSLSNRCEHVRDAYGAPFSKGAVNGYTCWTPEGSQASSHDLAETTTRALKTWRLADGEAWYLAGSVGLNVSMRMPARPLTHMIS